MELHVAEGEYNGYSPYHPLHGDQIRILVLKAGSSDSPLEASLRVVSLRDFPDRASDSRNDDRKGEASTELMQFEAISYCWGEPIFPRLCHFTQGGKVSLTESLHSALRAFRNPDRSRSLWADAVCINQTDLVERSSQVELMGDVFMKATRVLVWLGEPLSTGSDTLAFATLNLPIIPQGDRSRKDLLILLDQHLSKTNRCACCNDHIPQETPVSLASALSAVAKLLERPFFNRLWIVQEVVFAQAVEVYCGKHHAGWEIFTELSRVPGQYQGDQEYTDHDYATNVSRSALRQVWAQANHLNQLRSRHLQRKTDVFRPTEICKDLLMLSNLHCRSPHDRIFSVSRVLGLRDVSGLRADYSLPVAEVYRRVAVAFVTAQANRSGGRAALLLALASTETSHARVMDRPSWVPDLQNLSGRSRAKSTYYHWAITERQYYADAAPFRCHVFRERPQELIIRGRCFGEITAILKDSQCPSKQLHRRSGTKCPDEEGMQLIRWHARCTVFLMQSVYAKLDTPDIVEENLDAVFSCGHVKDGASLQEDTISRWLNMTTIQGNVDIILRQLKPYITGLPIDRDRVLCVAECDNKAVAGWMPPDTRIGDRVCQFVGAPYPFLIRARDDRDFSLLGDGFLAGVSEPEALLLDGAKWHSMLRSIQRCDEALKVWLASVDRKSMRAKGDRDGLGRVDERMKSARQDCIDDLKSLYRGGDQDLEWICLK